MSAETSGVQTTNEMVGHYKIYLYLSATGMRRSLEKDSSFQAKARKLK